MADTDIKYKVGVEADETSAIQTGKDIMKNVEKGIGNNGYIKLPVEITKFKYPKQTKGADGIPRGVDYSGLQKAQNKLISNWNKLVDEGFSSRDEVIMDVLKSFRQYQIAAKHQYEGKIHEENKDTQLYRIRNIIGKQISNHFTRLLGNVDIDEGRKGMFTATANEQQFEKYARAAISKHKAAQAAGIDLDKDVLTKEDRNIIRASEKQLEKQTMIDKSLKQKQYEKDNAEKIKKEEELAAKRIMEERAERAKSAVPIPKLEKPLEEVTLVTTERVNLIAPTDYEQTKEDKQEDKRFISGVERGAPARKFNSPNNEINLGTRSQVWDPTYLTEEFMEKMERGGTYTDTNALLRQTMLALPEEIKKSIEGLVTRIDKDEAMKKFIEADKSERKQWSDLANQTGMSKLLLANVAKVQGALMAGRKDASPESLKNAIIVAIADAVENGKSQIAAENYNKAVMGITNMLMNRYSNMKDSIGGATGEERGVGINYGEVEQTLKEVFAGFERTSSDLLKRAIKEFPSFYNVDPNSDKKRKGNITFDKVFREKLNTELAKLEELGTTIDKLLNYTILGNAEDGVANDKVENQNKVSQDIAKKDLVTGFNSDKNATELFGHQVTANRLSGEIKDTIHEVLSLVNTLTTPTQKKHNGDGNNRPPKSRGRKGGGNNQPPFSWTIGEGGPESVQSVLMNIAKSLQNIDINVGNILQSIIKQTGYIPTTLPETIKGEKVKTHQVKKEPNKDVTDTYKISSEHARKEQERLEKIRLKENIRAAYEKEKAEREDKQALYERLFNDDALIEAVSKAVNKVDMSKVVTSTPGFFGKLQDNIRKSTSRASEIEAVIEANKAFQIKSRAARLELFGENRGRSLTDTGDKASVKRTKELFGWVYRSDDTNKELLQDVRLSEGFNRDKTVDTTKLLKKLNEVLSGSQMFEAQTGGTIRNLIGSMTGYIGMPSLEKTRAEAEGLNQVMANVRNEVTKLIQSVQTKEMALKGMEDRGTAKFTKGGMITDDSSSIARKTFVDLEEQKAVLAAALAEVKMIDKVVELTGGKVHDIVKTLQIVMPELMENNTIIQHINAGLDKNGKALKFQKRTGEVLNYSFQLMSRHIGQMVKEWMMQLNPITQIKRAFADFTGYSIKWQRTMNVIKYNIRRIIKPFMEWLGQQFVNIIGLVNALVKGIGSAFGQSWDLFDKDAANAEKIHEELEAASDVSAGFDELHDIGSSDPANDLSGDIYTPQWNSLYEGIESFASKVSGVFATIYDTVKGWNFWNWLAVGATVIGGVLLFKWLIGLFSTGQNPLQSVADGFKTLQSAIGWAAVITSIALLAGALKDFIEVVGTMESNQVAQALSTLAIALGTVGLVILALLIALSAVITTGVGAAAVAALAGIIAAIALVVIAMKELVETIATHVDEITQLMTTAGEIIIDIITTLGSTLTGIIDTVFVGIQNTISIIGDSIVKIISGVATSVIKVLQPIMDFIDKIITKVVDLATVIAKEIGETIRTIVRTTGDVIVDVINALLGAIPKLLGSILNFCREIGPAIENSVDAIMRTVTKLINYIISGIEYLINTLIIGSINAAISKLTLGLFPKAFGDGISIPRFPQYEHGTNYVPNDGLAYLHQGEAVVPKKYNQPFSMNNSNLEDAVYSLTKQVERIGAKVDQGINIRGQFIQRGSDLVATVEKANNKLSNNILNNRVYAR